jgi:hypothetical protein
MPKNKNTIRTEEEEEEDASTLDSYSDDSSFTEDDDASDIDYERDISGRKLYTTTESYSVATKPLVSVSDLEAPRARQAFIKDYNRIMQELEEAKQYRRMESIVNTVFERHFGPRVINK